MAIVQSRRRKPSLGMVAVQAGVLAICEWTMVDAMERLHRAQSLRQVYYQGCFRLSRSQ